MSCSEVMEEKAKFFMLDFIEGNRYYWARPDAESLKGLQWHRELVGFSGCAVFSVWKGALAGDFIWNDYQLLVVSNRVLDIFKANDITGYSTFRVKIVRKGSFMDGYSGLGICGRGGPNDSKAYAGGVIPGTSIKKVQGLLPTGWDGSDLFTLDDFPGAVLATEKVKRLFEEAKVTNCAFKSAEDFSIGTGPFFD